MLTLENQNNAHAEIDCIFTNCSPQRSMPEHPAQIELSHRMLDAMLSGRTALCEAGTGIGKTYAYLVAAFVQHRYCTLEGMKHQPILIVNEAHKLSETTRQMFRAALAYEDLWELIDDLNREMAQSMWSMDRPIILSSGTLAVSDTFCHFEQETGLTGRDRLVESITSSPYHYMENCLNYLLFYPSRYQENDCETYLHVLADQIVELLNASYGHDLILFTSYAALSAAKLLSHKNLIFPVFAVGRKG